MIRYVPFRSLIHALAAALLLLPSTAPAELLVYYPFDTQNGTVVENLGSQVDGAIVGAGTYGASQDASFGTAFYGNRVSVNDAHVNTGLTGDQLGMGAGGVYTAMAWINWAGDSGSVDHMVFGQDDESPAGNAAQLHHGIRADSAPVNIHFGGWGGAQDLGDAGVVTPSTWTHVTWQYDGNDKVVYVNGVESNRGAGNNITSPALTVLVGGHSRDGSAANPHQSFNGAIDEVKVFDEALTAAQILAEMSAGGGGGGGDTDGDGLSDDDELNVYGTDPNDIDSDDDGMTDGVEVENGLDPASAVGDDGAAGDPDGDGLTNVDEVNVHGTDPNAVDTDGDGLDDGTEITAGTFPLMFDSDNDTLSDGAEINTHGTNPLLADTDGDSFDDNVELAASTSPTDASDFPEADPGAPLIYYPFNVDNGTAVENLGTLLTPGVISGGGSYAAGQSDDFGTAFVGNRLSANDAAVVTNFTGDDLGMGGNAESYTAMAWIFWNGSSGSVDHMVFGQDDGNPSGNGSQLHHGIRDDSGANVHFGGWGGTQDISDAGVVPAGEWTHVTWQYDSSGGEAAVYVNGAETTRQTKNNITSPALDVLVGAHTRDGSPFQSFNGMLDEVKIYGRTLTQEEIQIAMLPTPIGPSIDAFTASGSVIPTGSPLTISWSVDGDPTTLTIDQGIGDVLPLTSNGSGQITLNPGPVVDTTYTLTAENADGTNTAEITVSVTDLPIIEFFTASETIVAPGSTVQLSWSVINAGTLTLNGADVAGTTSLNVQPTDTTTWTLTGTNANGVSTESVTVTVVVPGEPAISEVSASNNGLLNDEDGESKDWIEIYNPSGTTAILNGYYLTDDPDEPRKWRLPNMTLPSGQHLIVFASGKDRAVAGSELHTNFSLSSGGEYLALTKADDPDTIIISEFDPLPRQFEDITWGVFPDGVTYGYFTSPTPGLVNGNGVLDFVRDTNFLPKRGFYDAPFDVAISSDTPGALIRYTIDGTAPTVATGTLYSGPINISTTTTLRALAYKPGLLSTNVDTQTYVFLDDVLQQSTAPAGFPTGWNGTTADYQMDPDVVNDPAYSSTIKDDMKAIPTMSIVMRTSDMFGSSGIYANSNNSGSQWERAGSVELMSADGEKDMQVNCAVRMQGGVGRNASFLKHSFRLLFKRGFGPTKLDYPLFEDATEDAEGATEEFDTVILRAGFNNSWHRGNSSEEARAQFIRDQFIHDTQLAMGDASSHGTFVHLYVNGLYWGLYNLVERPSAPFAAAYYGGTKDEWDALNSYPRNVVDGTATAWLAAHSIANAGVADQAGYDALSEYVDIPNLINYFLLNFYGGNQDWDDHNWYSGRRQLQGAGYKFFSWDAERSLENVTGSNRTNINQAERPSRLYAQLRANPEFRLQFADHAHRHMFNGGVLTPEKNAARYQKLSTLIDRAIVGESARWGDSKRATPYTRDAEWVTERDRLLNSYFPQRTSVLLGFLRGADLYPDTAAPVFSQHGGHVASTTELSMSGADGVIYYTTDGSDPRLPGGTINPNAEIYDGSTISTTLVSAGATWNYLDDGSDQGTAWRAVGFNDAGWASGGAELGYGDGGETTVIGFGPDSGNKYTTTYFRHAFNATNVGSFSSLTLELQRDDGAVVYLNGNELLRTNMPGGVIDYQTFAGPSVGGGDESTFFSFDVPVGALSEGANTLAVEIHQTSASSSDVSFDLRLRGIASNTADPLFMTETGPLRARALDGAEWSAINEASFIVDAEPASSDNLVISEFHYRPLPPTPAEEDAGFNERSNFEFVELMNIGNTDVDLTNVRFENGIGFDFDESEIGFILPAGGRIVLVNNRAAFELRYPGVAASSIAGTFSGNLSNDGEQLVLLASDDSVIRDFTYNDQAPWPESADGDGFSLVLVDPMGNPDHADALSWRSSVSAGGTPAAGGGSVFTGDPLADADGDGVSALVEYLLGTSDQVASSEFLPVANVSNLTVGGVADLYLTFELTVDLAADDVDYEPEISSDLRTWVAGAANIALHERTNNGDGSETLLFRSVAPFQLGTDLFMRLRVSLR